MPARSARSFSSVWASSRCSFSRTPHPGGRIRFSREQRSSRGFSVCSAGTTLDLQEGVRKEDTYVEAIGFNGGARAGARLTDARSGARESSDLPRRVEPGVAVYAVHDLR